MLGKSSKANSIDYVNILDYHSTGDDLTLRNLDGSFKRLENKSNQTV